MKILRVTGLALALSGVGYAATITNTSPFYLHLQSGDAQTCSATIAPGAQGSISGYCGYDVCATNDFNSNGCQEITNGNIGDKALTDGGYATYLGLSNYSGNTINCSIGWAFIPYQCAVDGSGNFSLNYKSITQIYSGGSNNGQPVIIPAVSKYMQAPFFRGVNVSGLEYDGSFLDALFQHPDVPDIRYFAAQGMNLIRLPIRAEFVFGQQQSSNTPSGPIISTDPNPNDAGLAPNNMYLASVYDTVQKYLASGVSVDLDLHNYMRFCPTSPTEGQGNEPTDPANNNCSVLIANQLAAIWATIMTTPIKLQMGDGSTKTVTFANLAQQYAPKDSSYSTPQLMFGIMNEPFDDSPVQPLSTQTVFDNEVAAVKTIRTSAPNNLILLSGNGWDPLHEWMSSTTQDSTTFTQSALQAAGLDTSNLVIEVHQYFDYNYSGTHVICNHYDNYQAFLQDMGLSDSSGNNIFGQWMQQNQMKVMLTEFGGSDDRSTTGDCVQDVKWMLQYMQNNAYNSSAPQNGGFIGWAAWRANRNGNWGSGQFDFLQQADQTVYGAPAQGTTGIVQGPGNGLMADVFASYLTQPSAGK